MEPLQSISKKTSCQESKNLTKKNFLQISSDGPNVNLKFLELMAESRETEELSPLIDIGTCRLHTVHNSLKVGIKSSRWIVGKVMKAMWKLLNKSPALREKFVALAETNLFPLPFCGYRWYGNEDRAERAELLWDGYAKFLKYLITLPKSRQPQGKSFTILKDPFNDPLMKAKLKFLEIVSNKLNKFLRVYQIDQPVVPFLCNSLKEILTSLLQMFILNDTIEKTDTTLKLMKIDTSDVNLHKPYDLIQIGTAAKLHVANYKKSTDFKESTLRRFYKEVFMLLASLTSHFMEKSPLKHLIVRCLSCFNPIVLADTNKLWKNWLPLVVLNQRRQTKLRTSMKKCWRN